MSPLEKSVSAAALTAALLCKPACKTGKLSRLTPTFGGYLGILLGCVWNQGRFHACS